MYNPKPMTAWTPEEWESYFADSNLPDEPEYSVDDEERGIEGPQRVIPL